jgi:hypothetical protein
MTTATCLSSSGGMKGENNLAKFYREISNLTHDCCCFIQDRVPGKLTNRGQNAARG